MDAYEKNGGSMDLAEVRQRMADGRLYVGYDPEIFAEQGRRRDVLDAYNALSLSSSEERGALLAQLVAEVGEGCMIEPPFHANWSGANLHLGNNVYANMGLTLVDDAAIFIEDDVMIGPNVTICTAEHPVSPRLRAKGLQYNKPVRICAGAWLGAGCVVLAGVTVGAGSVIGAGSVVTRDVPAGVIAVGNPCRVLREIGEKDELTYDHGRPVEGLWLDA